MSPSVRAYFASVGGFALALFLAAVLLAVSAAASYHYHPGSEFESRSEVISFFLFTWGGVLLLAGAGGFAVGFAPVLRFAARMRLPVLFGFLAGVAITYLGAVGILGMAYRTFHVNFLLVEAGSSLLAGAVCAIVAAIVTHVFPKAAGA